MVKRSHMSRKKEDVGIEAESIEEQIEDILLDGLKFNLALFSNRWTRGILDSLQKDPSVEDDVPGITNKINRYLDYMRRWEQEASTVTAAEDLIGEIQVDLEKVVRELYKALPELDSRVANIRARVQHEFMMSQLIDEHDQRSLFKEVFDAYKQQPKHSRKGDDAAFLKKLNNSNFPDKMRILHAYYKDPTHNMSDAMKNAIEDLAPAQMTAMDFLKLAKDTEWSQADLDLQQRFMQPGA